jgi:Sulfatase
MKLFRIVIWAFTLFGAHKLDAAATGRPNIVIIMSDDMGYSDLGCYGGVDAMTPNLDLLANGGVRFTQFYNTARCCPTRASLLTGLYPHQAGVGHMMDDRGTDGYRGNLNRRCVTIAEVLKSAGYRTYMTGKWHLTIESRPERRRLPGNHRKFRLALPRHWCSMVWLTLSVEWGRFNAWTSGRVMSNGNIACRGRCGLRLLSVMDTYFSSVRMERWLR